MIKFVAKTSVKTIVGFGISEKNVVRLKEGDPIVIDMYEMIPDSELEVIIFYGKTEESMTEELKKYVGEDTVVIGDAVLPKNKSAN